MDEILPLPLPSCSDTLIQLDSLSSKIRMCPCTDKQVATPVQVHGAGGIELVSPEQEHNQWNQNHSFGAQPSTPGLWPHSDTLTFQVPFIRERHSPYSGQSSLSTTPSPCPGPVNCETLQEPQVVESIIPHGLPSPPPKIINSGSSEPQSCWNSSFRQMQELSPPANCPDLNYPVYSVTPQHAIQPNYESSNSPKYFQCSYRGCLREFSTTWQFDIHFAFHTQNSRFSCSRCSQKFSRAVDLTRHERLSHSIFTCRRCEQVFSCRNLMDDHICGDQKLVATLTRRPDWRTIARAPPVVAPVVVYARVPQQNCP